MSALRDERQVLEQMRAAIAGAVEARRGLVGYSRLEAAEMDRRARAVEREALAAARELLPGIAGDSQLQQVTLFLQRMDERLEELAARTDIQERSRVLEQDDITWKTFEDIAGVLGVG